MILSLSLLMPNRSVIIKDGAQDQTVISLSGGKLHSLIQVLPAICIRRRVYVFTKDLNQLTADLKAADDKAAVIKRYKDALVVKNKVRCGF